MTDLEKAICILSKNKNFVFGDKDDKLTVEEIIGLLKAQEPVCPKRLKCSFYCGKCGRKLVLNKYFRASYCWECGREVEWQ